MLKKFSFVIFKVLKFFNSIFYFLTKRSFLGWLMFFLSNDCYTEKKIKNRKVKFYEPNNLISWRVRTILDKEPDTIEWIDNFSIDNNDNFIFGILEQILVCIHYTVLVFIEIKVKFTHLNHLQVI